MRASAIGAVGAEALSSKRNGLGGVQGTTGPLNMG
jgi:hypothetical protein